MNTMEELIKKMIRDLREQVKEKVPEEGSFPVVYERYENPDKSISLSHLILKVTAVPVIKVMKIKDTWNLPLSTIPNHTDAKKYWGWA